MTALNEIKIEERGDARSRPAASGRADRGGGITHRFTLEQTAEALTVGERVTDSVKAVIYPQQH